MAPIDPHQLLKGLAPLLTPAGAIKGPTETSRIVNLMKDANKLASRCVYINILLATEAVKTLEKFIEVGGWDVLNSWLQDCKETENFPVLIEMLKVYQQLPVTIELLKKNNSAKTIKSFSKSDNDQVKSMSSEIVDKWMEKVRGRNENSGGESKKKKTDKSKKSDKDKESEETKKKNSDKNKESYSHYGNKLKIKEEQLSESVLSKASTGIVTQTNGLKLHIKLERPSVIESDQKTKNVSKNEKSVSKVEKDFSKMLTKPEDLASKKKASTVKRPNVKFRSTGLEEDLVNKQTKKASQTDQSKSQAKRPGSDLKPKEEQPPGKRSRLETRAAEESSEAVPTHSPTQASPADVHNKLKITPPKSKTVIHESTNFIDSLIPDRPTGVIRRKKKTGATVTITSVPGASNRSGPPTPTTTKPPTPTSPHTPVSPTTAIKNSLPVVPSFYKDTLETPTEEKRSPSPPVLDKRSPSPTEENAQKTHVHMPLLDHTTDEEMNAASKENNVEAMDTDEKVGESKGLLTTGATGKKKKNKKVSWAEDHNLRVFHYFDLDESERENVNRPKDFNQLKKEEAHMDRKAVESARRLTKDNMVEAIPWRRPPLISDLVVTVEHGSMSKEKQIQKEREKGVLQAIFFTKEMLPDTPSEPDLEPVEQVDPKFIPLEDENSTGEDVFSHEKPANPVPSTQGHSVDPSSLFGQLNLPPEIANVLHSFQQGGTLPPNLDPASAQSILASMMGTMGDPNQSNDAFEKLKNILEPFQSMQNQGPMGPMHPGMRMPPPGPGMMGPSLLGQGPPGFNPMMGQGPGGPPRFPGGPGNDEWGENMIGGPPMRGRGRAGIPMRGGGPRGPGPGGPPMGPPPMRGGGRGGRGRQVNPDRAVCRHFAAGGCRRGNTCSFLHPGVNGPPV